MGAPQILFAISARLWQPQCQTVVKTLFKLMFLQLIAALFCLPSPTCDQRAQLAVSVLCWCQQDQPGAIIESELAAANQSQPIACLLASFDFFIGADDACQGAFIGQGQGLIAQFRCASHQLLWVRSSL